MNIVVVATALFSVGLYGVLTRRDLIAVLASVEVMLGGASVLLVGLARTIDMPATQLPGGVESVGVLIVVLAAAEAAVALAVVIAAARALSTSRVDEMTEVGG